MSLEKRGAGSERRVPELGVPVTSTLDGATQTTRLVTLGMCKSLMSCARDASNS